MRTRVDTHTVSVDTMPQVKTYLADGDNQLDVVIMKITGRQGKVDRYNIEPLDFIGVLGWAPTLAEARKLVGKTIQHPVKHTLSKAECQDRDRQNKTNKGKRR